MFEALSPRARRVLYIVPGWIAFLFLLGMYGRYALDMPYFDQWELVPLLEKAAQGSLRPADFWAQHNEHRLVFPRLVMLLLAHWSDWNIYWELATNLLLAVLTWLNVCILIRRTSAQVHDQENGPVYMVATLIIFSLSQWQNWFFGWQLQEFMNVLAIVVSLAFLTWRSQTTAGVILAAVASVVATYSFANGILIWPIGLLLLAMQRRERPENFLREATAWLLVGIMVSVSYLYGYHTPTYHAPLSVALGQPLHVLLYFLAYLGQPAGNIDVILAICMGVIALLVWAITLIQLLISRASIVALLPWIGMALYALGTATLTALGRVDEGVDQALSSRYVTMANLLWIPVVVQLYWVAKLSGGTIIRRLMPIKIAFLCLALFAASLVGAYKWTERYNAYSKLRTELQFGNDLEKLRTLYPPDPVVLLERRVFLKEQGLSIFKAEISAE